MTAAGEVRELGHGATFELYPADATLDKLGSVDRALAIAAMNHAVREGHHTLLGVGRGWACRECDPDVVSAVTDGGKE